MVQGAQCACTFFRWLFLHEKRGLEVQNFVTFPNSLWTFRKSKKNFLVFHSVLRWSRRCGLIQPPPRSQATSRSPALLGLVCLTIYTWSPLKSGFLSTLLFCKTPPPTLSWFWVSDWHTYRISKKFLNLLSLDNCTWNTGHNMMSYSIYLFRCTSKLEFIV